MLTQQSLQNFKPKGRQARVWGTQDLKELSVEEQVQFSANKGSV